MKRFCFLFYSSLVAALWGGVPVYADQTNNTAPSCVVTLDTALSEKCELPVGGGLWAALKKIKKLVGYTYEIVVDLDGQGTNLKYLFEILISTPTGSQLVQEFLPKYLDGTIKIKPMTEEFKRKNPGTLAFYSELGSTIFIDGNAPSAALQAPILAHEIAHSIDMEFKESIRKRIKLRTGLAEHPGNPFIHKDASADDRRRFQELNEKLECFKVAQSFAAERRAYTLEWRIGQELINTFPCYLGYLKTQGERGRSILFYRQDDEIINDYGFDRKCLK